MNEAYQAPPRGPAGLKAGKVPPDVLVRRVLPYGGARRREVVLRPGLGVDSAALDLGGELLVASTDPITGAATGAGWYAVHVACNDVAANGAEPVGVLLTLLLPERTGDADIERLMADADRAARELGVEILGGHTEILSALEQPVISTTALGRVAPGRLVTSAGARPGHHLILTKTAGVEGTAILAADFRSRLEPAVGPDLLERARAFQRQLSAVPDGLAAAAGGASAMHDVTEGGLLGALGELAAASGVGFRVDAGRIPVAPETAAVCRALGADPLKLISSGSMLVAAPDAGAVLAALAARGVPASPIGRVTEAGRVLVRDGRPEEAPFPVEDELWRLLREVGPDPA